MTIVEILPYISVLIASIGLIVSRKKDATADGAERATISANIIGLREDVAQMRDDIRSMRDDMRSDHDKIVTMERDIKAIWRNVDELKGDKS